MDRLGLAHTVLANIALVLGAAVVARRKGDRLHRTIGHLYVGSMLGVVVTALHIYDLFGTFGPFHVAAVVSLATLIAGMVPVVTRRPRRNWFEWHACFMGWSYVGLVAAAVSEAMVRIPSAPFTPAVVVASLSVTAAGAMLIHGRNASLVRTALRRAGVGGVVLLAFNVPLPAGAQLPVDSLVARYRHALEAAVSKGSRADVAAVRQAIGELAVARSMNGLVLHYLGYAWYREASLSGNGADAAAQAALDSSENALRASARLLRLPETHALLATVIGMRIGGSPWRGMLHGHRASSAMGNAVELEPDNPRVALLQGVNAFHTPAAFGGGMDRARGALERAIGLFEREQPHDHLPRWGHAEAWAWLGRVRARAGDTVGARDAYERALAVDPGYFWVVEVLLPALSG
ncbi:MAG TPA: DUF2306 domain-containing protein [Gemmatimonadaceae bacterium]|nr:DUF2306 domain-containing protein [Gemmatimonadaceae bacterium]